MQSNMITVSQDEYIRMINLLKYQAEFILSNVKVEEIQQDKEKSKEFLRMLNDLDLTFTDYLNAKDKYILTEENKKCIEKAKQLKGQLFPQHHCDLLFELFLLLNLKLLVK